MFDNLECISVNHQSTDFPKHFHETFCISLIQQGIERIDLENQHLYSEAGCISITNPYEVHANPLLDRQMQVAFDTIYVSKDLMKYLRYGENIRFANRKILNPDANEAFSHLKAAIESGDVRQTEVCLKKFAAVLQPYAEQKGSDYLALDFERFTKVNDFIENNLTSKFNLDLLAGMANINKYGFSKKFKALTGMSPINYLLMKKVFAAKNHISESADLTQIAFDYDFSDLPHFSKTFKKFVGLSPRQYQIGQKLIV